jgi:hypothetical protein
MASRTSPTSQPGSLAVNRFQPPWGFDLVVIAGVSFYFVSFVLARLGFINPGTTAWQAIDALGFPGGPALFRRLVDVLFMPVLAIHLIEVVWLDRSRLSKHGVARGGRVWWLWVVSCFFEGATAFRRFDRVVGGLENGKKED